MKRSLSLILFAMLAIGFATTALADDFMPPEWRGDLLSVQAEWDFINDFMPDPMNIDPDNLVTVGDGIHDLGTAYTHCHASDEMLWEIDPDDPADGRAYTDDLPGQLDFFLANWIDDYQFKHIWVQITWGGQGMPIVSSVVGPNAETNDWTDPTYGALVEVHDPAPGQHVEYWILEPNPDREHIYIDVPPFSWVDQVVIDTISTPDQSATERTTWSNVKALFD